MGMMHLNRMIAATCFLAAAPAAAQTFNCDGIDPDWNLRFDDVQARFSFPAPTDMDVVHSVQAEGLEWPRAYTLIGNRDTAIVVLQAPIEGQQNIQVLTQRAEQPILLNGTCIGTLK